MSEFKPTVRVRCSHCGSRLDVLETSSGGRTVSVIGFGPAIDSPRALESFVPPGRPDLGCPACGETFDPRAPYRPIQQRKSKAPIV